MVTLGFEYLILFDQDSKKEQTRMIKTLLSLNGDVRYELLTDRVIRVEGRSFDNTIAERKAIDTVKQFGLTRTMTYHALVGRTTQNLLKNKSFMDYISSLPQKDTGDFVNLVIGNSEYSEVIMQYFITQFEDHDPVYNSIFPMLRELQKRYSEKYGSYERKVDQLISNMTSIASLHEANELVDQSPLLQDKISGRIAELQYQSDNIVSS